MGALVPFLASTRSGVEAPGQRRDETSGCPKTERRSNGQPGETGEVLPMEGGDPDLAEGGSTGV